MTNSPKGRALYSRRGLLALGLPAVVAVTPLGALARTRPARPRSLKFRHLHTGETLSTVYHADGRYQKDGLKEINWILRDWRTDEQAAMDHRLLDLLHRLHQVMDSTEPFEIISGYRSSKTNKMLANKSRGVAKKSLHMRAMAADISLPGRDLENLYWAARTLKRGGTGFYAKSGFIHVDCGRVRFW
ncbi:MAG: DUF882 domain-containing protein [Alphaproteobacteria bacterium]|nr:DUF882 domain-containing protein [Alphaproteobacteria bacterium]